MNHAMIVFGTRPEIIKLFPVIAEMQSRNIKHTTCFTGQHDSLAKDTMSVFNIRPDVSLEITRETPSLNRFLFTSIELLDDVMRRVNPSCVIVQGDTVSAFAAAMTAFYLKIPVVHIEAGLRSFDIASPFPEEAHRVMIDDISTILFAPTERAAQNIRTTSKQHVYVVGNTEIDSLYYILDNTMPRIELIKDGKINIIITAHRRENIDSGIDNICRAANALAKYEWNNVIFIMHKNPVVRNIVTQRINAQDVHIIEPPPFDIFAHYLANSDIVITDSGGIQEDCAALGIPVIVAREKTERVEGVINGCAVLVPPITDDIVAMVNKIAHNNDMYQGMASAVNPYGDGSASQRIVDILTSKCYNIVT